MWAQLAAFGLVAATLGAFLVSSLQLKLGWRIFALVVGSVTLALAIFASLSIERSNLFVAIWTEWPMVRAALAANMRTVQSSFSPVLDISLFMTGILGVLTAVALTPGDALERVIRPIKKGMIGVIIGCVLTLFVVGLGFGAQTAPNAFIGYINETDITDGDTLKMGSVSLRLWGIDAAEDDQTCLAADGTQYPCGAAAKAKLVDMTKGQLVSCQAPEPKCTGNPNDPDRPLRQTFGRPIVTCSTIQEGKRVDLARELAKTGHADVFIDDGKMKTCYEAEVHAAVHAGIGMWSGSSLRPSDWRNNKPCRAWIATATELPAPIIDCTLLPAANDN